ncbi:MAG: hypothetical protein ACW99U_13240 [Candidatus Thorarchaeota archaeon]
MDRSVEDLSDTWTSYDQGRRGIRPLLSLILWIATAALPIASLPDIRGDFHVFAPLWWAYRYTFSGFAGIELSLASAGTSYIGDLGDIVPVWSTLGIIVGIPIIASAFLLEVYSRGLGRYSTFRNLVFAAAIVSSAGCSAWGAYYGFTLTPIPIASLVQYMILLEYQEWHEIQRNRRGRLQDLEREVVKLRGRVEPTVEDVPLEAPIAEEADMLVQVARGCAAVGGKFEYKVKIKNDTDFVINNVTVTILGYPEDCLSIDGSSTRTLVRISPKGFSSPQFVFVPTKDCVEGKILSTVSYIDHREQAQTVQVEPYVIKSVCDLLEPLESTLEDFDTLLHDMTATSQEILLAQDPERTYSDVLDYLPERNFQIISDDKEIVTNELRASVRGLAEGKYTKNKVAVRIGVSGPIGSAVSKVMIEALSNDPAMLPTTIEEIMQGLRRT